MNVKLKQRALSLLGLSTLLMSCQSMPQNDSVSDSNPANSFVQVEFMNTKLGKKLKLSQIQYLEEKTPRRASFYLENTSRKEVILMVTPKWKDSDGSNISSRYSLDIPKKLQAGQKNELNLIAPSSAAKRLVVELHTIETMPEKVQKLNGS